MEVEAIGRYRIKSELGRGGMATVFLAEDPSFGREVAVKVLPREFLHDPTFLTRFEREARTIAGLEHTAIVPVYDFGESDGQPYLVMRHMAGGSLREVLERGPVTIGRAKLIVRQVAGALDYAHARGIIHRDLKPGNLLFDDLGNAFLTDFGIVKLTQDTSTLTGDGVIGTPAYMSPEQAQGAKTLDRRSDLYSLGVILFHMLTGSPPYEADTPIGLAVKHVTEPVPRILDVRPDFPVELDGVLQLTLAKSPEDRYATAGEFAEVLATVPEGETAPAPIVDPTVLQEKARVEDAAETVLDPGEKLTRIEPAPAQTTLKPETPEMPPRLDLPLEEIPGRKRKGIWWALGGIGVLGAAVVAGFLFGLIELPGRPPLSDEVPANAVPLPSVSEAVAPGLDSSPPTSTLPFAGAVGDWRAVDLAGSQMTLTISKSGYGTYVVKYYDTKATICGTDAFGDPRYAGTFEVSGRPNGPSLLLSEVPLECLGYPGEQDKQLTIQFHYFPDRDGLRDSTGREWSRAE